MDDPFGESIKTDWEASDNHIDNWAENQVDNRVDNWVDNWADNRVDNQADNPDNKCKINDASLLKVFFLKKGG